jgi:lipopolysaccharide transport system ATP-binding protein
LLKILSRITYPTSGIARVKGRLSSLLEVGTGFHPELSGRDNVYLNGALLGMSRKEIKSQYDAIVDFAGISKFMETPVKHYSSGMYVRLAFAVAAHLRTEVLLIDEVLAVGDAAFQKKCLQRTKEARKEEGRTVLFVSHNMSAVRELCEEVVWLENGQIRQLGEASDITAKYLSNFQQNSAEVPIIERKDRIGTGDVILTGWSGKVHQTY